MKPGVLRDYISVRGRFHRSVQLARDVRDESALSEYVLTPTARELAQHILMELRQSPGARAWSITGPYGTGKSAFALFLTTLLCQTKPSHPEARHLRHDARIRLRPFVPILLVGQRAPLIPAFLTALAEGLQTVAPALARKIGRAAQARRVSEQEVVAWMEQAAQAAKAAHHTGLLIIVDEFGKFLEYTALHPETEDLLVMQQLAEAAARSPTPILLLTILHTAFAEYLHAVDQAQRTEWQKVQGRFADIAFYEPTEQLLQLLGTAIECKLPASLESNYRRAIERLTHTKAWSEARQRFPDLKLLMGCIPLHPVTALLLCPLFRSKLAQNERSLFAFLTGPEPFGSQEFLTLTSLDQAQPLFFRIDRLYDYMTTALGATIYTGDRAHRWAEIGHALDRVMTDAPPLAAAVIKATGLLGLYGATVGLCASRELLNLAFDDPKGVGQALDYLERASIVVYRKHEQAYGLWEGSDVDLDACLEEARRHVGQGDLATRLQQLINLRPLVARAHYIRTGTLRYFTVRLITGTEQRLSEVLEDPIAPADGQVLYVLTPSSRDRQSLIALAKAETRGSSPERHLRLLAFPKPMIGLEEAVQEVESWRWISENVPALQGDPVARREVRANSLQAWERLESIAGRTLGLQGHAFDPNASEWVQGGDIQPPRTGRQFLKWLSALCDESFDSAPPLRNELLNRDRLSSAAAKARRNLLEAMLTRETEAQLGFSGTPPEVSMYRSLLAEGGFHRRRSGQWQFGKPRSQWRPVWRAIQAFLETTRTGRRPVLELFRVLKQPPFGLRDGPLPVILCAVLLTHRDDVALYEEGVFVPDLRIEVIERLLRVPEQFELQWYAFADEDRKALAAVGDVLEGLQLAQEERSRPSPLLRVIKPLVIFAARLPAYAKNTKRIDPPVAIAVRDALLRARDPYALIRVELPAAVGLNVTSKEGLTRFPSLLRETLLGLQRAYPRLLDEIEMQVRVVFDLRGNSEEARQQLQARAAPLQGLAAERSLALFVREAGRLHDRSEWREVLGRVVNGGLPPSQWHDVDLVNFQVRLTQLAGDFLRLEELAAEKRRTGATQILRIGLLDGRLQETREIVAVTPARMEAIERLTDQLAAVLEDGLGKDDEARRVRVAALARVAARYLERNGRSDSE